VKMSNFEKMSAGLSYRTKIMVISPSGIMTDSFIVPKITLYDASRNIIVSNIAMTKLSSGVYEYTYTVPTSGAQGVWEAIASTEVESGKTIYSNDYWEVVSSPAQVIVNSVSSSGLNVSGNVTITNEGLTGYEYHYEWCVVTSQSNPCGGGDDVYYGSAAKYINPGEDWNKIMTATVLTAGDYYFKVMVYFGTEKSGASRSFTVSNIVTPPVTPPGGGGGGGGGGGVVLPPAIPLSVVSGVCKGPDLNGDGKVNSVDFSILMYFWKTKPPFKNTCVDLNVDGKVNAVDFSIMLFNWTKK